jgi:glucose-1-phosphate thymidylyltransferase
MKGIILAGGTGSRLWPITRAVSKQLLPVYDKPMIFYPLSTLMLAGIKDVLIITTQNDQEHFMDLLGRGTDLGLRLEYEVQPEPKGLAQALIIGEKFLAGDSCLMILGDNIFHGTGLGHEIVEYLPASGAHIFTYNVSDPSQYGVLTLDTFGAPVRIEEKPKSVSSNLAVTGLYFFDGDAPSLAKKVTPSERGELEITSLIEMYLQQSKLTYTHLSRGAAWLDTGNPNSLHDAATYIRVIEERTGQKIACPEEVSWRNGWIDSDQLDKLSAKYLNSSYGHYLSSLTRNLDYQDVGTFYLKGLLRRVSPKMNRLMPLDDYSVAMVMPLYKPNLDLLLEALTSIAMQERRPDEYIFVFDGLDDSDAREQIKTVFPNAKIVFNEVNQGQGGARNTGVALADSSLVAFLDQDDFWGPYHLSNLLEAFRRENFAFGYSDISEVDYSSVTVIPSMMDATVKFGGNNLIKSGIDDLLFRDIMIFPSSSMVRRDAFLEVGGFAENMRGHEDDHLFRMLIEAFEAHFFTGEVSAYWRKHDQGTSNSSLMSESRLQYGIGLIEKYQHDRILQLGCYIRFANSFIREITAKNFSRDYLGSSKSMNLFKEFSSVSRELGVSIPARYRLFVFFPQKNIQATFVQIYKFWRSVCARVR